MLVSMEEPPRVQIKKKKGGPRKDLAWRLQLTAEAIPRATTAHTTTAGNKVGVGRGCWAGKAIVCVDVEVDADVGVGGLVGWWS
jgi:hypothetical protein